MVNTQLKILRVFGPTGAEVSSVLRGIRDDGCPGLRLLERDGEFAICVQVSAPNRAMAEQYCDKWAARLRTKFGDDVFAEGETSLAQATLDALLEKLVEENRPFTREGRVAGYIPELAKADRDELGICVVSSDGRISSAGEYRRTFTIQSIIKPILLLLALMDNGEDTVRARVGVEATGKPFDAINYTDQALLSEHLNPMVNMGAILLCTLIHGTSYSLGLEGLLVLTGRLGVDPSVWVDEAVYRAFRDRRKLRQPVFF